MFLYYGLVGNILVFLNIFYFKGHVNIDLPIVHTWQSIAPSAHSGVPSTPLLASPPHNMSRVLPPCLGHPWPSSALPLFLYFLKDPNPDL